MQEKLTIAVLAGTTRQKRESIKAAHFVADFGRQLPGVEILFVDPSDFAFPGDGNDPESKDPRYTEKTAKADAFFIVAPEYNHSFPGTLKRMLDSELETYKHKPVALAGTSNGAWGGVRCVEALTLTARELGLVVTSWSVYFPRVQDMFDDSGALRSGSKAYAEQNVGDAYDELIWMAKTLKWGRTNIVQ